MYKIYAAAVLIGTILFVAFYIPANSARIERETAKQNERDALVAAEEAKRKADEEAARAADRERREAREREENERIAKLEIEEAAKNEQIRQATADSIAASEALRAELEAKRKELESIRESRMDLQKQVFDGKKANELARIQLRTSQLDAQRVIDLVAARTGANPAILLPPPPPPAQADRR
jgi:dTMP kinase